MSEADTAGRARRQPLGPPADNPFDGPGGAVARERLLAPLARVRRRARLYLAITGALRAGVWLVGLAALQLVLDRWFRFSVDQRVAMNLALTGVWAVVIWRRLVRPLVAPLHDHTLATAVDRLYPELRDRITTAVEFLEADAHVPAEARRRDAEFNSPELIDDVVRETAAQAERIGFLDVLNHARARRHGAELAGLGVVVAAAWLLMPTTMSTWFQRTWLLADIPWPQATYITPIGFDAQGVMPYPRGDELVIVALNEGELPKKVTLHWSAPDGRSGEQPMARVGEVNWQASLGVLTESLSFTIRGGDESTREYTVRAVDRPQVVETVIRVSPPAYTGLEPLAFSQQTVVELLRGSTVEIEARLNKPVATAALAGAQGPVGSCTLDGARLLWRWDQPESGSYAFALADQLGFENVRPVRLTLKVAADLPPEIVFELPGVSDIITAQAELPVRLRVSDAYGLSAVRLYAQRNEQPPIELPLAFSSQPRAARGASGDAGAAPVDGAAPVFEQALTLSVADLGVTPGERLSLWVEARDNDPAGPNVQALEPLALRVLSLSDFVAALAQRELELRQEFERLVSAQRGLNDALLRLLPELEENQPAPAAEGQQLSGLARRQETHAQRTLGIAERFAEILEQMRISRVSRGADERRIDAGIVTPLSAIGERRMPQAAEAIAGLRRMAVPADMQAAPPRQAQIVREMQAVLADMLEWEGYREAVALLGEIIDAQGAVHTDTVEALESQIDDILGLENPPAASPAQPPKP